MPEPGTFTLALCLVAPVAVLVTVEEAGLFTALTWSQPSLELSHRLQLAKEATNAQLWWSILAGLPLCWWLRRFTRALDMAIRAGHILREDRQEILDIAAINFDAAP